MREFLAETGPEFSARVRGQAGFASEYIPFSALGFKNSGCKGKNTPTIPTPRLRCKTMVKR